MVDIKNDTVCPKCNGIKLIFMGSYYIDEASGEYLPVKNFCDLCEGKGVLDNHKQSVLYGHK